MKKITTALLSLAFAGVQGQIQFDPEITWDYKATDSVVLPPSPLKFQVLFVGGVDKVQTTATYGNPAGEAYAKEWHDFIGITEDKSNTGQYWISVNHEMVTANDSIGDGGGMTVFKVGRDANNDTLMILQQNLKDGRQGKFFNVDFSNTVGETGMNCGGIISQADGRIWTAEEWWRGSNKDIADRDTSDFTIGTGTKNGQLAPNGFAKYNGSTIKKFENYNYMVEIDPKEAVAIRKQYNWGRQAFEGGVILPDNKTVFLGVDATPGFFTKFVAKTAGDFTDGQLYIYVAGGSPVWEPISMDQMSQVLSVSDTAVARKATMFNRIEWVTYDVSTNKVYFTETGRDKPAGSWKDEHAAGAQHAAHHLARATAQGTHPDSSAYYDYYGRVLSYNLADSSVSVHLEGGPYHANDIDATTYASTYGKGKNHLSNPDGLGLLKVNNKTFLIVQEDLNGSSHGRVPQGFSKRPCELFILDLSISNPTVDDLIRITHATWGAEITGGLGTPDGKTILANIQHPETTNKFPFNHSLTMAITGFDQLSTTSLQAPKFDGQGLQIFPNPTSRMLFLSETVDAAIYDLTGKRINVYRNTNSIDVAELQTGTYLLRLADGTAKKFIVQ